MLGRDEERVNCESTEEEPPGAGGGQSDVM